MVDEIEHETLKADRKAPQRRCIVTRESYDKDALIRFVIGPGALLVPDVAAKLPGRGYWVCCRKDALEQAVSQKLFVKLAKEKVILPDDLADKTEKMLQEHALQALSLANKAGQLVVGFEKVDSALRGGRVVALIHAEDASPDSMKKLAISSDLRFSCFPAQALSTRLGVEHAVHVALLDGPAGLGAVNKIRRFTGFLQIEAL